MKRRGHYCWVCERVRYPPEMLRPALQQLDMLNAARDLRDLRAPPGNRLEMLRGDLAGFHRSESIASGGSSSVGRLPTPSTFGLSITTVVEG